MVRSDGFSCTDFVRFPDCQLTYSVESAVAQNRLSSCSLLKSGILFFVFGIDCLRLHQTDVWVTRTLAVYVKCDCQRMLASLYPLSTEIGYWNSTKPSNRA
jgi:hypothetical protein